MKPIENRVKEISPLLKLIRIDNIDFTPIFGAKSKLNEPHNIYFKIKNVNIGDFDSEKTLNEIITNNYLDEVPSGKKEYYICFRTHLTTSTIGKNTEKTGGVVGFAVSVDGIFYDEISEYLWNIFNYKHILDDDVKKHIDDVYNISGLCYWHTVVAVRDKLNLTNGEFITDNITQDVYIQRRLTDDGQLIDYILGSYYIKILNEINWMDISNEGTIYSAL
jgi:hypothetical protein